MYTNKTLPLDIIHGRSRVAELQDTKNSVPAELAKDQIWLVRYRNAQALTNVCVRKVTSMAVLISEQDNQFLDAHRPAALWYVQTDLEWVERLR